jgi:hypothetical protein
METGIGHRQETVAWQPAGSRINPMSTHYEYLVAIALVYHTRDYCVPGMYFSCQALTYKGVIGLAFLVSSL